MPHDHRVGAGAVTDALVGLLPIVTVIDIDRIYVGPALGLSPLAETERCSCRGSDDDRGAHDISPSAEARFQVAIQLM